MLDLLILSAPIGFVLGIISGLIPDVHANNFALIRFCALSANGQTSDYQISA